MLIGVPSEIKEQESRVGLTPRSVKELISHGHSVIVENNAGYGAGFDNSFYEHAYITVVWGSHFNWSVQYLGCFTL